MIFKHTKALRYIAAAMAIAMTIGFTGCSNGTGESSSDSSTVSDTPDEQTEYHKVGYIFRESASDGSFAAQMCEQRERASNRSSMDTCYIENVSLSDFEGAVKTLSDAGCTDIVACSSAYANLVQSVAKKYLDLNFICFGTLTGGINVSAYSESLYQGAYVAGLVANFNSDTKKIGVVADTGLPETIPVVNAVELGAELDQDGGATVYAAGAEKNDEIEQAVDALIDKGCDVIICYTNSDYSAEYCQQKGIKFISNLDFSEQENKYSNMLMYFYCKRDSYFLAQFKSMKLGTFELTSYIGDMSNGIVNVSPALSAANDGTQKLIDALVPHITSGAALVFRGPLKDTDGNVKYLETDIMTDNQIAAMDWYVRGVEVVGNFRKAQTDVAPNSFEIKY